MIDAPAPDFSLMASNGREVSLANLRGQFVVLIFYPKNNSPNCNKQLDDWNLNLDDFLEANARVFGINTAPVEKQRQYCMRRKLEFPILSDPRGGVAKKYQAFRWLFPANRRTIVVVDPTGRICFYKRGKPDPQQILSAIKQAP